MTNPRDYTYEHSDHPSLDNHDPLQQHNVDSTERADNLRVLYQENGLMCRIFLDWRHRVLLRYSVTLGALVLLTKWLFESPQCRPFVFAPAAIACIASFVFLLMDTCNKKLLSFCYSIGAELEGKLSEVRGFHSRVNEGYPRPLSYTVILRYLYLGSTVFFLVLAIALMLIY